MKLSEAKGWETVVGSEDNNSEEKIFRRIVLADVNGRATLEESAWLRSKDNARSWRNEVHKLLTESNALQVEIREHYEPLILQASEAGRPTAVRELKYDRNKRISLVKGHRKRLAAAFSESETVCQQLRNKHLPAEERLRRAHDQLAEERTRYRRLLWELMLAFGEECTLSDGGNPTTHEVFLRCQEVFPGRWENRTKGEAR